jgi:deoxyribonuclease IV
VSKSHPPLFGAHMSIAGGVTEALRLAEEFQCDTLQLFTKSPSQWQAKPIPEDAIREFRKLRKQLKLKYPTGHDSYLINLASPDTQLLQKSIDAFVEEMERAESLELTYLVMHPGAHLNSGEEIGITRVAESLDEIAKRTRGFRVQVLLETTAGQGTTLGHRFEHLAGILQQVNAPEKLGICVDTCHLFAAGYDLSTPEGYRATFEEMDSVIGLGRVKVFHVNDSAKPLGSRVDRHAGLGKGKIGRTAFQLLVNDSRFRGLPMILETPKEDGDNNRMDEVNLAVLRGLTTA